MSDTISTAITHTVTLTSSATTITSSGSVMTSAGNALTGLATTVPSGGWSITNEGSVTASAPSTNGINLAAAGSILNTGVIAGYDNGINVTSGSATVTNTGTIDSSPTKIVAGSPNNLYDGIYLGAGGSVTNTSPGTIFGGIGGIDIAGGTGTVNNTGLIETTTLQGNGVSMENGGTVINAGATGIYGAFTGVAVYNGQGVITNSAMINAIGLNGYGVYLGAGGTVTNTVGGSILGSYQGVSAGPFAATLSNAGYVYGTDAGVDFEGGGLITNLAGGVISAVTTAVEINGGTVINGGTIAAGSTAVSFGAGLANDLVVQGGGVFSGAVTGGGSGSVLELGAETNGTTGTLTGIGGQITGFDTITFDAGDAWQVTGSLGGFSGDTINGFAQGDSIVLSGAAGLSSSLSGTTLSLTSGGTADTLAFNALSGGTLQVQTVGSNTVITIVPCFAVGTRIVTPGGERPVENLAVGDEVLTILGEVLRIVWTGSRAIDCSRHDAPEQVRPVRIAAHAFSPGMPRRNLYLSPDHGVFAQGALIPVKYLINGTTIRQIAVDQVTYHHIELERHAVILADGLGAESFLDIGDRSALGIGRWPDDATEAERGIDVQLLREALACAPIRVTGPLVDRVRDRLAGRACQFSPPVAA
jgi:collagen type I/II/III/V/XI/XXIV/XXVII alpha